VESVLRRIRSTFLRHTPQPIHTKKVAIAQIFVSAQKESGQGQTWPLHGIAIGD